MEHRSMTRALVAHSLGVAAVLAAWWLLIVGVSSVYVAPGAIEVYLSTALMGVGQVLVWRRVDRWLRRDALASPAV